MWYAPDEDAPAPAAVVAKEQLLTQLKSVSSPLARWKAVADVWCAAWFWGHGRAARATPLSAGVYHDLAASVTGAAATLPPHQHADLSARVREMLSTRSPALSQITRSRAFVHSGVEYSGCAWST